MITIRHRYTGEVIREAETLVNANLRNANLLGADLRNANLYGANLRGANLYGADLVHVLPVGDPRGYCAMAVRADASAPWTIQAGCRAGLTIAQAREHWGASYEGDREIGDRYLYGIDWFERWLAKQEATP